MGFSISPTRPRWRPINPKVKLAYLLREHSIITDGNGHMFVDCKPVILKSYGHVYAGHLLIEHIVKNFKGTTAIAGIGFDGYAIASAVACMSVASNCYQFDALYVDKQSGVVEGSPSNPEAKVVLLGGSINDISLDDIELINKSGYEAIGILTLVGHDNIVELNIPVHSIFTQESIDMLIREWEGGNDYAE